MSNRSRISQHRWWTVTLGVLITIGVATEVIERPGFWSSYVLDIIGPAGIYILRRRLYRREGSFPTSKYFTSEITAVAVIGICFLIEFSQYLGLYDAHFDPYDFVAYLSGVLPCYVADRWFGRPRV